MERLRQSDLQSLLVFLRECYAFHGPEPFERFVLRLVSSLPRLIPAAHVTYNEMYPEKSKSYNCTNSAELGTATADHLWQEHMNEHPVMVHVLETIDRHARRISDFWSQRQLHDRGLHNDFYKLYDIEDALCITIPCPLPRIIGVGWHDSRIFSDRERLIADLVRPHISQAWQNARLIEKMRSQMQILGLGMESLGAGMILCTSHGRVRFMNSLARGHLAEYFGASRPTDRLLPDDLLSWVLAQAMSLSRNDDAPPVRGPLVLNRAGKRLTIRLLSEPDAHMILMEEQQLQRDANAAGSFGLTAREAEVLSWVARGKTNQEIAIILAMHTATVKKHVEHILEKLGVETRTAAAAVALANHEPDGIR